MQSRLYNTCNHPFHLLTPHTHSHPLTHPHPPSHNTPPHNTQAAQEIPNTNPFAWDAAGHLYVCLAGQFTVYMAATLLVDTRAVPRAIANGVQKLSGTLTEVPALLRRKQRSRESQGRGGGLGEDGGGGGGEGDVEAPLLGGGVQQHEGVQGGVQQYEGVQQQQYGGGVEDPDVEAERLRVQHGMVMGCAPTTHS